MRLRAGSPKAGARRGASADGVLRAAERSPKAGAPRGVSADGVLRAADLRRLARGEARWPTGSSVRPSGPGRDVKPPVPGDVKPPVPGDAKPPVPGATLNRPVPGATLNPPVPGATLNRLRTPVIRGILRRHVRWVHGEWSSGPPRTAGRDAAGGTIRATTVHEEGPRGPPTSAGAAP